MRRLICAGIGIGLLLVGGARSVASESLRAYVHNELGRLRSSAEPAEQACFSTDSEQVWQMRRFYLSIAPQIGMGITMGVAEVSIQPYLQLMWEQPIPPGWDPYHPKPQSAFHDTE